MDRVERTSEVVQLLAGMARGLPLGLLAMGGVLLALGFALHVGLFKVTGPVLLVAAVLAIGARFLMIHRIVRGTPTGTDDPATALCDLIIEQSVAMGAREVHLSEGRVRIYHEGTWKELFRVPIVHAQLVHRLKVMASLDMSNDPTQQGPARVTVRGQEVLLTITVGRTPDGRGEARIQFPVPP